ncbi:MAG: hypothetical protein AAGC60_15040 [Acidobacteriota bacterium]
MRSKKTLLLAAILTCLLALPVAAEPATSSWSLADLVDRVVEWFESFGDGDADEIGVIIDPNG